MEKEVILNHLDALLLVKNAHEGSGHHGRDVMRLELSNYWIYRSEAMIELFRVCIKCESFKRFVPDEEEFHPIISDYSFQRLHLDVTYPKELRHGRYQQKYLAVGGKYEWVVDCCLTAK